MHPALSAANEKSLATIAALPPRVDDVAAEIIRALEHVQYKARLALTAARDAERDPNAKHNAGGWMIRPDLVQQNECALAFATAALEAVKALPR